MTRNHDEPLRATEPARQQELLNELAEFLGEWEGRAQNLAFFPSPAAEPAGAPTDTSRAIDEGLTRAAALIGRFREDDSAAVDYYHLSDIVMEELRDHAEQLFESVQAHGLSASQTTGYSRLAKALDLEPVADHPLAVFRRVWTQWRAQAERGTDGTPLPAHDPLVDRLLTEAGVDAVPPETTAAPDTEAGNRPPVDLAAENARLRGLLAELILEYQRFRGHVRRFGLNVAPPWLGLSDGAPKT